MTKLEPDGLCHFDGHYDSEGTWIEESRVPWPNGGSMPNHVGKPAMPVWTLHRHTDECLLPIAQARLDPELWKRAIPKLKSAATKAPEIDATVIRWEGFTVHHICTVLSLPVLR